MAEENIKNSLKNLNFPTVAVLLVAIGLLSYANAVCHPFVHDDLVLIVANPRLAHWDDIGLIFTRPFSLAGTLPIAGTYYRPILELVYKIQYSLFSLNPHWYHFCNVILHLANGFFVYAMILLVTQKRKMAWITAAVFLVHPVQSEAVAAIAGISNILFSFFCLTSFLLYLLARAKSETQNINYLTSLFLFILALLTKEQAVVLPFAVVLYEYCFPTEKGRAAFDVKRLFRLAGFFVVAGLYLSLRNVALNGSFLAFFAYKNELFLRILSIPSTLLTYGRILLFPTDLHYFRCTDMLKPFAVPLMLFVAVVGTVIAAVRFGLKENRNILIFGAGWFIVWLLPVLNIIPMVEEYSFLWTAEHFLYLPMVGFVLFVLVVVDRCTHRVFEQKNSLIGWLCLLVVGATLVGKTMEQNNFWRGEIPLFERAVRFEKNIGRLRISLARAYYNNGQFDKAVDEYRVALRIMEEYSHKAKVKEARDFYLGFMKGIHFDLAHCYEAKRDLRRAIDEYKKAIAIDPNDSTLYNNLGSDYLYLGESQAAMGYFQEAVRLDARNVFAMNNLAVCYIEKGDMDKAEFLLRKALNVDRRSSLAGQNLERLLNRRKR